MAGGTDGGDLLAEHAFEKHQSPSKSRILLRKAKDLKLTAQRGQVISALIAAPAFVPLNKEPLVHDPTMGKWNLNP